MGWFKPLLGAAMSEPKPKSSNNRQHRVIIATWNLECFTLRSAGTRTNAEKISNITTTVSQLAAEGTTVILALQEVLSEEVVTFWRDYLAKASNRTWASAVSPRALGRSAAERAAFLWTCAPELTVDVERNFHMLGGEDFMRVVRAGRQDPGPGLLRSPFFGLFRLGKANICLVNVHLASDKSAAGAELLQLQQLAEALQTTNKRLFQRRALLGLFKRRQARGILAVLGDFNTTPPTQRQRNKAQQSAQADPHPWTAFQQLGWSHALDAAVPTTHRAKKLQHIDDVWVPTPLAGLVTSSGVCKPLPYMRPESYPNHLLVFAELDTTTLQERGRLTVPKVRPLTAPRLHTAAA